MEKLYRFRGRLVMDTGFPGQQHEQDYDFVCEEWDYSAELLEAVSVMTQKHIKFDTKNQTVEEVEE